MRNGYSPTPTDISARSGVLHGSGYVTDVAAGQSQRFYSGVGIFNWCHLSLPPQVLRPPVVHLESRRLTWDLGRRTGIMLVEMPVSVLSKRRRKSSRASANLIVQPAAGVTQIPVNDIRPWDSPGHSAHAHAHRRSCTTAASALSPPPFYVPLYLELNQTASGPR
jgi:hypothetical protein